MAAQGESQSRGDALERLAKVGTYRTLGEQVLSPQEERFEKARRTIGLFLAPAVFLIFFLLPLDMDETQQKLAAALLFVDRAVDQRGGADPDRRPARHRA